jgi:hypothetical protein
LRPKGQHHPLTDYQRTINRARSRCLARGEHAFHVVKRLWGFAKVRYRELARAFDLFALANLYLARRRLLPRPAQTPPVTGKAAKQNAKSNPRRRSARRSDNLTSMNKPKQLQRVEFTRKSELP